jgi:hypothetical protein
MTTKPKKSKALRGATKPRLHSPLLKGQSKLQDVKDIAAIIGEELLPWQEFVLKDMLTVDKLESNDHLKGFVKQIRHANGTESIEMLDGTRLDVVAATRDGSRGRSADFLYIDELREVSEEGYRAAIPTTRAKPNAQTLLTSNAGDAFSL